MKYILELEDEPNKEYFGEGNYYRCKQIPYWSISESMRNRLEPYDEANRKTENSSEKPNNSTISKMEQVETMSCAECKHRPIGAEICEEPCHYEPQTDWHYDEQDATWYPYKHEDEPQTKRPIQCSECRAWHRCFKEKPSYNMIKSRCPIDEPQTNADQHVQHVESVEQTEREGE